MKFKKLGALILGAILTVGIAAGVGLNENSDKALAVSYSETAFGEGKLLITTTFNGSTYYLPATTTSSSPKAMSFTDVSEINEEHLWTITKTGSNYYIQNDEGNYLYTISDNKGVRVNNTQRAWKYDSADNCFQDTSTSRYLGIYNASDWRCYTSHHVNYKESSTSFKFYKIAGTIATYKILATSDINLLPNQTKQIRTGVVTNDTNETVVEDYASTITYVSSSTAVATVSDTGLVTAVGVGETIITVSGGEDAKSFEIPVKVGYTVEDSISYSSKENSDGYDSLNGEILTKDETTATANNAYFDIVIDNGNMNDAKAITITETTTFKITPKENVSIVSVDLVFGTNVTNFNEYSDWENATKGEKCLIPINPSDEINLKTINKDESDNSKTFTIDTITVNFIYKTPINNFSTATFNIDNVKTNYDIYDTFSLEGLKVEVVDDDTNLTYEYYYGDTNMIVVSNIKHGSKLTSTTINEITLEVSFANDVENQVFGTSYTITISSTLTLLVPGTVKGYAKVTTAPSDWAGDYLIVYEDGNVAFNGGLDVLDAVSNYINVTINNGVIESDSTTDAAKFTIDANGNVKSASGYSIGQTSDANGLKSSKSTTYTNTISMNDDGTVNLVSGGAYLRYNSDSGQNRFRYYKSSSYTGQKAICLYRLEDIEGYAKTEITEGIYSFINTVIVNENPLLSCDSSGLNSTIDWDAIKTAYTSLSTEDKVLLQTAKAISAEEGGNIIEDFLSDYDYLVSTYSQYADDNFIGRPNTGNPSTVFAFNTINQETTFVIVLIALVSLSAFAFVYVAKRKQRKIEL